MARTLSAPKRRTFAVSGAAHANPNRLLTPVLSSASPDTFKAVLFALAPLLAFAGVLAPHTHPTILSWLLLSAGVTLAVFLMAQPSSNSPAERKLHGQNPAAIFPELCTSPNRQVNLDRAAWARLTAHMSHEFRTPLNAVLGFSELMSNEALGPIGSSCYGAYARDIHASGRMLLKSAEDALAITALLTAPERKGTPATACLRIAVEEALTFHAPALAARRLRVAISPEVNTSVVGEPQTMRQILVNLIADAAESARDGATITVSARSDANATRLSITLPLAQVNPAPRPEGFSLLLASTLCELSGAQLTVGPTGENAGWQATFAPALQHDLFASLN